LVRALRYNAGCPRFNSHSRAEKCGNFRGVCHAGSELKSSINSPDYARKTGMPSSLVGKTLGWVTALRSATEKYYEASYSPGI